MFDACSKINYNEQMFTKLCNMKAFPCFTELLRHLDLNE
jgi:hypothetical protein